MFKVIGFILVVFSCSAIGWMMAEKKNLRLRYLEEWQMLLQQLRGEIAYSACQLPEIIMRLQAQSKMSALFWSKLLLELDKKQGICFATLWKQNLADNTPGFLKEKDLQLLSVPGETLGMLDQETQLHTLDCYLERMKQYLSVLQQQIHSQTKVTCVTWMVCGCFLAIMLW